MMLPGTPDLAGRTVLVCGEARAARRAVARYRDAGAEVLTAVAPSDLAPSGVAPSDSTPAEAAPGRPTRPEVLDRVALVVVVRTGADDDGWGALAARCRERGILLVAEPAAASGGNVTLVGGGPGRADLLTVAARAALAQADVVFYDRLGPAGPDSVIPAAELVAALAPGADLVDVGKTPGHHKVPQGEIERQLVEAALAGRTVVRLKGGDPFVFGRGAEEVRACAEAGVPVTVLPGVTSAISVPGAVGVPVTHRGVSKLFTVASGHQPFSEDELEHLAGLGGTIVLLMGVGTLPQTTAGLLRHGLAPETPAVVIERGFCDTQRSTAAPLDRLALAAAEAKCSSPAVIVIGDVVASGDDWTRLAEEFGAGSGEGVRA
ncbi:uroporphyrinogen-III C-methyltransferase [Zhihengliuella sp.]|uniref:uroporphyrinogen-III C-methyltransferase n=1 Tax=Zhihengliuella sp. TaxID=1954483 RepID=UPI0028119E27|nr:uroporphyrinogen-III C-methyltransferase [Zhihengliuella sp.]